MLRWTAALVLLPIAVAQPTNTETRTLTFTGTSTPIARLEIANAIRALSGIAPAGLELGSSAVVTGSPDQVEMASWVFDKLDRVAHSHLGIRILRLDPTEDSAARVFFPEYIRTPQQLQEFVNVVRAVSGLVRIMPAPSAQAIALRDEASRAKLAEWLFDSLDQPSGHTSEPLSFHWEGLRGSPQDQAMEVRIVYPGLNTPQELQELINALRVVSNMTRLMPYNPLQALIWRGTKEQDALGDWLLKNIRSAASGEYEVSGDVVKILHLPSGAIANQMTALRTGAGSERLAILPSKALLIMRGTGGEIARAEQLIRVQETTALR